MILASGSNDETINLWNLETLEEIKTLSVYGQYVYSVSFSPDSKTLALGSDDKVIELWNLDTFAKTKTLSGHDG